ncbi:ribose 5-phosphate isomerase B [Rhodospira trueperi]|uniref:Ribose 5-phosphate isomerase B n=1 Tax=Rhodospira trueperi TaxID=69960 RepID=A0A1G6XBV1_9PROT|nr:ribose 5-phosphate isomerase B [Rhodospira trueperi]SDD75551.1 ribose 5-phosphate isomerase B [Rhodospira trueperi]
MSKAIALASDHGAIDLRCLMRDHVESRGLMALDLGTHGTDSVDYPDFAAELARAIQDGRAERGILLCGTGIGASIAINRYPFIRAALVHDVTGARLCREHNDANVLVLGGRTTGPEVAKDCVNAFLDIAFEGGRHARRVEKLGAMPSL